MPTDAEDVPERVTVDGHEYVPVDKIRALHTDVKRWVEDAERALESVESERLFQQTFGRHSAYTAVARELVDRFDVDEGVQADMAPRQLHRAQARYRRALGESLRQVADNIPNNPETGDPYAAETVRSWTIDVDEGDASDD